MLTIARRIRAPNPYCRIVKNISAKLLSVFFNWPVKGSRNLLVAFNKKVTKVRCKLAEPQRQSLTGEAGAPGRQHNNMNVTLRNLAIL